MRTVKVRGVEIEGIDRKPVGATHSIHVKGWEWFFANPENDHLTLESILFRIEEVTQENDFLVKHVNSDLVVRVYSDTHNQFTVICKTMNYAYYHNRGKLDGKIGELVEEYTELLVECSECGGDGRVCEEVKHKTDIGVGIRTDVERVNRDCDACNGKGKVFVS